MSGTISMAYLLAGVLFIRSLGGLSQQETARSGNLTGIVGMALAVVLTVIVWVADGATLPAVGQLAVAMGVGAAVGVLVARRVEMTGMPELVAMLHSFVGLAAVLVGVSSYLRPAHDPAHGLVGAAAAAARTLHTVEIWIGVAVGALTVTGSLVAWAKLRGTLSGKPLLLPGRHGLNLALVMGLVVLAGPFMAAPTTEAGLPLLLIDVALAGALGVHLVMGIGGADMPVVVSLLNAYSGWAAAALGFVLSNDLLIVTGALVGASGTILSVIMCRAMNRSILSVVFGGFGATAGVAQVVEGDVREMRADEVARKLGEAKRVVVIPGYGMAVARAQGAVAELTRVLRARGVSVLFAIHPVAGRLPGHMNVLLAEAGVPYDMVLEMDEINKDFPEVDVALVIGANDIVNPGALDDPGSPIYGMPVLEVWRSHLTVVLKRGMAAGYAGVDNPLFTREGTRMLFGDAKKSIDALVSAVKEG